MSKAATKQKARKISAQCDCDQRSFAINISEISCEGCAAEAAERWGEDCDFIHLKIADSIDVNGRVLWHKGRRATIRFFGQIHPHVVNELARAAA